MISFPRLRQFFLLLCLSALGCWDSAHAGLPPAGFSQNITYGTETVTVHFSRHPIRSANFRLLVQDASGALTPRTVPEESTYLGAVAGYPGALASGVLRKDGSLLCRISFENGLEWSSAGGVVSLRGDTNWSPGLAAITAGKGGAGAGVYAAEAGIDCSYRQYLACGSDVDATLEMAEFSVMSTNLIYLRDAAILHRLGTVVVRTDSGSDPYEADGTSSNALLTHIKSLWNAGGDYGSTHHLAVVVKPGTGDDAAYFSGLGTPNRYGASSTENNGDFTIAWRHEAGHNWGSTHCEGGGQPEGPTVMSGNSLSRISSPELAKILATRNGQHAKLDFEGAYTFPLPPRANMDDVSFLASNPVRIDVLINDSDSNGDALSLLSFPANSLKGATLSRSTGTGPDGRDEILYTPSASASASTMDSFSYRISDASGNTATGYAIVRPDLDTIFPIHQWKLDEPADQIAADDSNTTQPFSHEGGVISGQPGASPGTARGVYYDGIDDRSVASSPSSGTYVRSITCWIKRDGPQPSGTPLVYCRGSDNSAGIIFGADQKLSFNFGIPGNLDPSAPLQIPDGEWCLVSMVVSTSGVTVYARTSQGLHSATDPHSSPYQSFTAPWYLAHDGNPATPRFKGWMDDVRVYNLSLSAAQIESHYQQALNPPQLNFVSPIAGSELPPLDVPVELEVPAGGYSLRQIDFFDGGTALGTCWASPYSLQVPSVHAGTRALVARAYYGNWGYAVDSAPLNFTVGQASLPLVTISTSGAASHSGPDPADFVITRSHSLGEITVPLLTSGDAVAGLDYQALPASVTLPDGALSKTVRVTPIAAPPQPTTKTVTLTLGSDAGFVTGSPSSANLAIDDHVTSLTYGQWNQASVWTSGAPAPVTGIQNTGNDYIVAHTIRSNDPESNNQALIAHGVRIRNGGILELARLHGSTAKDLSYNLPKLTLEKGGCIRFLAWIGSVSHRVPAALDVTGKGMLQISGGNFSNNVYLQGPISGSGNLALVSDSSANSIIADLRQLTVTSANNPYSGDWSIIHTGGGDESASLQVSAANALGTGTVSVNDRSRLVNDVASGLNSLRGVVLEGTNSLFLLNLPWINPAARLVLSSPTAEVKLGNGTNSIGNLSGTAGTITGRGAPSILSVNQTQDASFAGKLGVQLRLIKTGSASLELSGTIDPSLRATISAGRLAIGGSGARMTDLTQNGGDLQVTLSSSGISPLTISNSYTRSGSGRLVARSNGIPVPGLVYPLVTYQSTLTSTPDFSYEGAVPVGTMPVFYAGSGYNSTISLSFLPVNSVEAWAAGYGLYGADASASADPDQDGVPNAEERLLGFNPSSTRSRLVLSMVLLAEDSVTLRLNRVVTAGSFSFERADSLSGPWTSTPMSFETDASDYEFTVPRGETPDLFLRVIYQAP